MHAKSLSFLAGVSLFAVLAISAIPAQSQATAAAGNDLNAKAHAIFDKGAQLNGLTSKDMQPYHLKATYELYEGDPTPEAGTLEVWSTGPDTWKRTYTGKKYSGTEWSVTATERYQAKGDPKVNFDHAKLDLRIGIPVTNLSVNPARSTGPAVFVGGWALAQLWLFWLAPIVGAAIAGIVYHGIFAEQPEAELVRAASAR